MISSRIPAMAIKTPAMIRIAYNLMRLLMKRAAYQAGVSTGGISFEETLALITSIHESFRSCAGKPRKRESQIEFLIEMLASRRIDLRPLRREPWAVKRRPKPFPLLNAPRHEFVEIPHRSLYRKLA